MEAFRRPILRSYESDPVANRTHALKVSSALHLPEPFTPSTFAFTGFYGNNITLHC